jgi:ethanolamine ammonia-lyase small subunit
MTKTTRLGAALDAESYEWLQDNCPDIADGVAEEVANGVSPDAIRRYVLAVVGPDRSALAARCMAAARHLHSRQTA